MYKRQTPHSSSVTASASSTVVHDKVSLGAVSPALPVIKYSAERLADLGPLAPSAVSHSVSRVAGTNRALISGVPAAPPLLPSPSQTALLSLLPSRPISSRAHGRRAATTSKPHVTVDYGFDRTDPTPPTVPRPAPIPRQPRLTRSVSPFEVSPGHSIDPVPTVPIQHATNAATPAPILPGALPPDAPWRTSTSAALAKMPSPS